MRYNYVTLCTDIDKFNNEKGSVIKIKKKKRCIYALSTLPEGGVVQGYTKLKKPGKNKLRHMNEIFDISVRKGIWRKAKAYLPLTDKNMYVCITSFSLRPLIIFLLFLVLLLLLAQCSLKKMNTPVFNPEIEVQEEISQSVKEKKGEIKIKGFTSMAVSKETGKATVLFENPEENDCYFVFSVYLNSGTLLYKSKMLPPGRQIRQITFDEILPEGEYQGYVLIDTYNMESGNPLNKGKFNITIKSR